MKTTPYILVKTSDKELERLKQNRMKKITQKELIKLLRIKK